jgi:hypothetical protein
MSDSARNEENEVKNYNEDTRDSNDKSDTLSLPRKKGVKDKIVGRILGKSQENNNLNLTESARVSNNVRTVILGLFTLIGFIILVFAVFTASIGAQLDQVQFANSVFIAAIVGAFTLVGVIVYQIRGSN